MQKYELRLSGSGGQGLILAGIMLGEAASIYDGKESVQSQSYGPEARGGASRSEVIISDLPIDFPKVVKADFMLSMTQESYEKYISGLKEEGILLIDSFFVTKIKPRNGPVYSMDLTRIAIEKAGKKIFANVVSLGAIVALTGIVSLGAMEKTVLKRAPGGTEDLNLRALEEGYKAALEIKEKVPMEMGR
ncbi:MAG: 2-oxoacid:acceptor oxidoreductase family protein [bacterium]